MKFRIMKNILYTLAAVFIGFVLIFFSNFILFNLVYIFAFVFIVLRNLLRGGSRKSKIYLIIIFAGIMVIELVFNVLIIFEPGNTGASLLFSKIIGAVLVFIPFIIEQVIVVTKYDSYDAPSVIDTDTISYSDSFLYGTAIADSISNLKKIKETITYDDIISIMKDLPRHSSFRYINKNSLTPEYFEKAYDTINDENIYMVLSNTGSSASKIISLFTKKIYNHVSVSFDSNLETIISYNGGENLYPPGLNPEMIEWFNKNDDASIIVYRLEVPREQKRLLIEKVADINRTGNAYNMLGLVLKLSAKPNILFCSQFLYKLLEYSELNYFEKDDGQIKPTDFIELDYYRKLKFHYELKFNRENQTKLLSELPRP